MALPVWGNLEKSQIDNETIEEAIARLIQEHEDDANAHVETGESLHSHKASAIIDHLALSIITDKIKNGEITVPKLNRDKFFVEPQFESLDGYNWASSGSCSISSYIKFVEIQTGTTINSKALFDIPSSFGSGILQWTKNPVLEITVGLLFATNQNAFFGMGDAILNFPDPAGYYTAFKIINGNLYAETTDSADTETTPITGIAVDTPHDYKIEVTSLTNINYYVDGVLKATHNTITLYGTGSCIAFWWLKNTTASNMRLFISTTSFYQDF